MHPEEELRLFQSSLVDERAFAGLKERLAQKRKLKFITATASMRPRISPGEEVVVVPIEGDPKRFDIVVYWDGKNLVCHVFWHRNSGEPKLFTTRALDTRLGEDLPAAPEALLGRVKSHRLSFWDKLRLSGSAWLRDR